MDDFDKLLFSSCQTEMTQLRGWFDGKRSAVETGLSI